MLVLLSSFVLLTAQRARTTESWQHQCTTRNDRRAFLPSTSAGNPRPRTKIAQTYGWTAARPDSSSPSSLVAFSNSDDDGGGNDDDNSGEIEFYDDFGGQTIGGGGSPGASSPSSSPASSSALQERIQTVQKQEIQKDAAMFQNWNKGNWQVRGFSLDPDPALEDVDYSENDSQRTHASRVVPDPNDPGRIWVGRTDGSLLGVQLGTEYWTKFRSKLSASSTDDGGGAGGDSEGGSTTISVSSKLVREDGDDDTRPTQEKPFEILFQSPASLTQTAGTGGALTTILVVDDDCDVGSASEHHGTHIFTACDGSSDIRQWLANDDDGGGDEVGKLVGTVILTGAHDPGSTIVALKAASLQNDAARSAPAVLCSVASDGSLALWELRSGDLLFSCRIVPSSDDEGAGGGANRNAIRCADSDGSNVFVGTGTGQVLVYEVRTLLEAASAGSAASCPLPAGRWTAGTEGSPVTAIACGGDGSLGRGRGGPPTLLLLTGDENGVVRQWEILSRRNDEAGTTKFEQWPKLATQRLPKKAHVFKGHEREVTALRPVDGTKFLSASADGSVAAWDASTGKKLFSMEGFTESIRSLCMQDGLLVTDGMKQFVCVHDFDVDMDEHDFDLSFDEFDE